MMLNNISSNTYPAPNFRAKFIKKVPVQKLDFATRRYKTTQASFVEFEPENEKDLKALAKAQAQWDGEAYATEIVMAAGRMSMGQLRRPKSRIFVLTTQADDCKNLDKDSILGMAQMIGGKTTLAELKYFQVRPDIKFKSDSRDYKGVGKAILDSLKGIYTKAIKLQSCFSAADFYEKQGFQTMETGLLMYLWQPLKHRMK